VESPRRSLVHRLRLPIAAAAAAAMAVATAVGAMADCGNLAAATLSGEWQLKMTVEPPTGTVPAAIPKVGTAALQTVSLSTVCSASGQCTATLAPSGGGILPLYDNSVQFIWYPSTGLAHAGSSYSGTTPRSGYGGPGIPPCPPPANLQHDILTLTVVQAKRDAAGGWQATVVSGSEVSPEGWVCVGGAGQSTVPRTSAFSRCPWGRLPAFDEPCLRRTGEDDRRRQSRRLHLLLGSGDARPGLRVTRPHPGGSGHHTRGDPLHHLPRPALQPHLRGELRRDPRHQPPPAAVAETVSA